MSTTELWSSPLNRERFDRLARAVQISDRRDNQTDYIEENGPGGLKALQGTHATEIKIEIPDGPSAQAVLVSEHMRESFLGDLIPKLEADSTTLDQKVRSGKLSVSDIKRIDEYRWRIDSDHERAMAIHDGSEPAPVGATPAVMTPYQNSVLASEERASTTSSGESAGGQGSNANASPSGEARSGSSSTSASAATA